MAEMHFWEKYLVHGWKENETSKSFMAGKFVLITLPAWKEQKSFLETCRLGEVLLEGENSFTFHSKFRNSIASLSW